MKRLTLIALILTFLMVLAMPIVAFADDTKDDETPKKEGKYSLSILSPAAKSKHAVNSSVSIKIRANNVWTNYYTVPAIFFYSVSDDEVVDYDFCEPVDPDLDSGGYDEYAWKYTMKNFKAGTYRIGLAGIPGYEDGELYEGWEKMLDEDKIPFIDRTIYVYPSGKVVIRNTIANSVKRTNDVIWDKSQVKGASNYQINWRARGASKWASRNVGNVSRWTTTGLTVGNLYEFRVRPYRAGVYGDWSHYVYRYFHTTEKIRLKSSSKGSFTMSWKKNPKATGYQVMFTTNKNGEGAAKNINTVGPNATSFTKKGLRSGVTYYVQVREIRKVGGTPYIGNISKPIDVRVR